MSHSTGSWQMFSQFYDLIIKIIGEMSLYGFYLTVNVTERKKNRKRGSGGRERVKNPIGSSSSSSLLGCKGLQNIVSCGLLPVWAR